MPIVQTPFGSIDFDPNTEGPARPADVKNRPEDPEGFAAWKEQAKKWRAWSYARDNWVDDQLKLGASLEDLGILPIKEHGLARWNKFAAYDQQGNQDRGYIFDWQNGMKKNVATSDQNATWVPITQQDWNEYRNQQAFGSNQGDYIKRMQADQRGWITRAVDQGQLYRDSKTGLLTDGNGGYYDEYGAFIDPNTHQRTGGVYGEENLNPYIKTGIVDQRAVSNAQSNNQATGTNPATTQGAYGEQPTQPFNYYEKGYSRPYLKQEDPLKNQGWNTSFMGRPNPSKVPIDTSMPPRQTEFSNPAIYSGISRQYPGPSMPSGDTGFVGPGPTPWTPSGSKEKNPKIPNTGLIGPYIPPDPGTTDLPPMNPYDGFLGRPRFIGPPIKVR